LVKQINHKNIAFITISGLSINALLILLSIFFAKERMLFLDSSIYLFEIINRENFYFPYRRFANVFNQFLPLIGVKLHFKTHIILLLYSLNIQLLFTTIFLIIHFGLKQKQLAFAIPLFQLMICYESFFLPVSELSIGIAFLILWLAVSQTKAKFNGKNYWFISIFLSIIIAFSHPILILPILFVLIYNLIEKKSDKIETIILFTIMAVIIMHTISFYEPYESERTNEVLSSTLYFSRYELYRSFNVFIRYVLNFPLYLCAGLFCTLWLFQEKKWLTFILFAAASMSCIFVIAMYMNKIYFIMPFFEIYLIPISFITAFFIAQSLPKKHIYFQYVIGLLMLVQLGLISQKSNFFKERLAIYDSMLYQMNERGMTKAVADFLQSPIRKLYTLYDTPFTPLLISDMDKNLPDLALTLFITTNEFDLVKINERKHFLFVGFDNNVQLPQPIEQLNKSYFLVDTSAYQFIEFDYSDFK
jgi:hypothetical protein